MGGDDDFGGLGCRVGVFLQHGGDADVLLSEDLSDLRQHPGAVGYIQPQVVFTLQFVNGLDAALAFRSGVGIVPGGRRRGIVQAAGHFDDVAHYRAGRRPAARPLPVKQHPAAQAALDFHRVIHPVHFRQHIVHWQQGGINPGLQVAVLQSGNG